MLRYTRLILAAFLVSILTTGCVRVDIETEIEKDGSGESDLKFTISKVVTDAMAEMNAPGDVPDIDIVRLVRIDRDALQAAVKSHDVKIQKLKTGTDDGCRTLRIRLEFEDLEGFSYALGKISNEADFGVGVFDAGDGNLVFKDTTYRFDEPAEPTTEEPEPSQEVIEMQVNFMQKVMGAMTELKFSNTVTVPGDVVETNAHGVDGRTCTWKGDFASMRADKDSIIPRLVFSGDGLKIKRVVEEQ